MVFVVIFRTRNLVILVVWKLFIIFIVWCIVSLALHLTKKAIAWRCCPISFVNSRNRTPSEYIGYALYFYFSGLSLRRTSERLACFIRRNHVSIWNWIQKYKPQRISSKKKNIEEYVLDETIIKAGSEYIWLWVAIEPKNKEILGISISKERNMFVAERFLSKIVEKCGDHPVSTDGGTWYLSTSVQVFKYGSSHSLPIWKKYRRKDHTIHQGQNWMFWRLLSMQKKEM